MFLMRLAVSGCASSLISKSSLNSISLACSKILRSPVESGFKRSRTVRP